jgi:predicted nucleotidyltransferase
MKVNYFSPDIQEFLRLLHEHEVKYLIVGGEAVIYYGYPRLTGDVDFFFSADDGNVESLFEVLYEFWDEDIPGLNHLEELQNPDYVIQFGVPPNRIDLFNKIEGVGFKEAWKGRVKESINVSGQNISIYIIGLPHLIINKRKTARNKDLEDLNYLESISD